MKYRRSMKHRTRIDMMSQILEIANGGGATRAKIQYKAFLSYVQLREFLRVLTENDLLSYDVEAQTFKTTEKGLGYLDAYNQIGDIVKALQ
ncbi:MAG TPA: winged helix-turn-helix domain-containing protein [Nitrososphaeraceae archaeon]|nr:winged helix-turn-helix domain-containing protein [Nitrososphaeraceae archaeon]